MTSYMAFFFINELAEAHPILNGNISSQISDAI